MQLVNARVLGVYGDPILWVGCLIPGFLGLVFALVVYFAGASVLIDFPAIWAIPIMMFLCFYLLSIWVVREVTLSEVIEIRKLFTKKIVDAGDIEKIAFTKPKGNIIVYLIYILLIPILIGLILILMAGRGGDEWFICSVKLKNGGKHYFRCFPQHAKAIIQWAHDSKIDYVLPEMR